MKKVLLVSVFLLVNCFSCKQAKTTENHSSIKNLKEQQKQQDVAIEKALILFYKQYMNTESSEEIIALRKKYLAKELLDQINNGEYDYDPVLNAQDVSPANAKTIRISKEGRLFKVCYTWIYTSEEICVKLIIDNTQQGFNIKEIIE